MDCTKKFHYGISVQVIYPVFITLSFVCVSVLVCADECMFTCVGVQGYLQVLGHMCVHICRGLKWVVECLPQPVTLHSYLFKAIFLNEPGASLWRKPLSLSSECQDRRDFPICLTFTGILEIDVGCWLEFTRTFNWWDKHGLCMWFVIPIVCDSLWTELHEKKIPTASEVHGL